MTSPKCALCDETITSQNDTKEHLIPNAIGGRKKIKVSFVKAVTTLQERIGTQS